MLLHYLIIRKRVAKIHIIQSHMYEEVFLLINIMIIIEKNIDFDFNGDYDADNPRVQL